MLVIIGMLVGIALLGKGAKKLATPPSPQFSNTAMTGSLTRKNLIPDGALNFTPAGQTSVSRRMIPFPLLGVSMADPARRDIVETYESDSPTTGIVGMLAAQRHWNGGS